MKKLKIMYEDKYLLIVNKPVKLLTIATNNKNENNLYSDAYNYLHNKNQKVFIVNRLDKDTSGIVVFAKNENVKELMQNNWDDTIRKYYAIVDGIILKEGVIESYLKETKTFLIYITKDKNGKYAKTKYVPITNNQKYTLLDIQIFTGRKNQIRVQLSSINHSIVGDKKYGLKDSPINRMCLHAYYLEFIHPITKEKIIINDQIPDEFNKLIKDVTLKQHLTSS